MNISQKVFADKLKEGVEEGKDLGQAKKEAAVEAYGTEHPQRADLTLATPEVRQQLGLDDVEAREIFSRAIVDGFSKAINGEFPEWLGDDPKLKLDYLKTMKGDLASAFITKKEHHVLETDETRHRTDEELAHRLKHGKWPEEMTIQGEDSVN